MKPQATAVGRGIVRAVLSVANRLIPKQNKVVLSGFPAGEDSIREIAHQLGQRPDLRTIVLTDKDTDSGTPPIGRVRNCEKRSLAGLWHYLTARYVFFTHGLYLSPAPPKSQTCVNVWHGMPIKRVGRLIGKTPPRATINLATSGMFRGLVASCFGVPDDTVLITGIPRNDVMVRAASRPAAIKQRLGLGGQNGPPRLIVWLPTFRKSVRGIIRDDGRLHDSIFGMDDMDVAAFSAFLQAHDCVCVIKPHPMAADFSDRVDSDWLRIVHDRDLRRLGVSLYEAVGAADLLITDASSVYVDFLLLDKPVVIAFPDIEEYRKTRGFALDPIDDFFAGPVARTFRELTGMIEQSLDQDPYSDSRKALASRFHDNMDAGATARLIDLVCPERPASA